jgi:hypothetical protein
MFKVDFKILDPNLPSYDILPIGHTLAIFLWNLLDELFVLVPLLE